MPLVSSSIIDKWYHTDSWVFKNFKFLFSNPLWDKNIPRGFSLCPYFWLSLLSLFVVQPFVYSVMFFSWCVKKMRIGKILTSIDSFLEEKIWGGLIDNNLRGAPGFFTFFVGIFSLAFIALATTAVAAFYEVHTLYSEAGILMAMYFPLILSITLFVCGIYSSNRTHSWSKSRCKVEYYVFLMATVFSIVAVILHPTELLSLVSAIATNVYLALSWLVLGSIDIIVFTAGYVWAGIVFSGGVLASFFKTFVYYILGVVTFLSVVSFIGYKVAVVEPTKKVEPKTDFDEYVLDIRCDHLSHYGKAYGSDWHEFFMKNSDLKKEMGNPENFYKINEDGMKKLYEQYGAQVEKLAAENRAKEKAQLAEYEVQRKKEKERREKWEAQCKVASSYAAKVFNGIMWLPTKVFKYPCKVIVWCAVQSATFTVLLWKLFWAWKKGACPYIRFIDADKS